MASGKEPPRSWNGPIVAAVLLAVLGIGGMAFDLIFKSSRSAAKSDQVVNAPPAAQTRAPTPKATPVPPAKSVAVKAIATQPTVRLDPPAPLPQPTTSTPAKSASKQPVQPLAARSAPKPAKAIAPVDAGKRDIFARAVADARAALAGRHMATAEAHIKTASANAQTPEDRDESDRLETLSENLTQFWNGIGAALAKLQPADEIVLKDSRLIVVESRSDYLEVRTGGRKSQYRIETLPTPLVLTIVEQTFAKDPGSKAIIASFLAVDPQGDRATAKRYWQEAAGAGFDCEKLIRELDERVP